MVTPLKTESEWDITDGEKKVFKMGYNNIFECIDTPEKSYWLGFIQGDGSIGIYGRSYRFGFSLKLGDKYHLEKLTDFIGYDAQRVFVVDKLSKNSYSKNPYCKLQINSKNLVQDLMRHGILQRKSYKNSDKSIPENYKFDFIRGLFDADGTIMIYNRKNRNLKGARIGICGNRKILQKIQSIIKINGSLIQDSEYLWYLIWGGRFQTERVADKIYNNTKIYLNRKKDIYDLIKDYNQKHKYREYPRKYEIYKNGRPYIKLICERCGKEFESRADHAGRDGCGRFCSRQCANIVINKTKDAS